MSAMLRVILVAAVLCACSAHRTKRAAGGEEIYVEKAPWTVQLEYRYINETTGYDNWTKEGTCLGVLINGYQVITAAHCADESVAKIPTDIRVRAGSDLQTAQLREYKYYELERVQDRHIHPEYKSGSSNYDLAILNLREPFKVGLGGYHGPKIDKIDIASPEQMPKGSEKVMTTGWGYQRESQTTGEMALRGVELKMLSKSECASRYVPSLNCFQAVDGKLHSTDAGTAAWLPKTDKSPFLLVGINSASFMDDEPRVALFNDLTDPKNQEFIKNNWVKKGGMMGGLKKIFG